MATIDGTSGDDTLNGTSGDDTLTGFAGNDTLDGGDGTDKAVFSGAAADYLILHDALTGTFTVVDKEPSVDGDDGTDVLTDIETLEFSDLNIDLTGGSLPLASADTVEVDEDGTLNDVLPGAGGIDGPDGGTEVNLTYALVDTNGDAVSQLTTAHGVVTLTNAATGAYTFEPAENYHGADSFTFRVTDERGISSEAVVDVTVNSVNDDPVVSGPLDVVTDPNFDDVTLLLKFEGDLSDSGPLDATVTNVGSLATSSAESKFGGESLDMTATAGHTYTQVTDSDVVDMGTSDYTIEGWFYATNLGLAKTYFTLINSSGTSQITVDQEDASGTARMFVGYGAPLVSFSNAVSANQWQHVALVRDTSAGVFRLFVDGVQQGTLADSVADHDATRLEIGTWTINLDRDFEGYIDEFRVTKGVARYTSDFTVPDQPFPDENGITPYNTTEDTAFSVTEAELLANASDVDGGTLSVDAATLSFAGGAIVQTSTDPDPRVWQMTPAADANGVIQLTYDIIDGQGGRTETYAEVQVNPVDDLLAVDQGIANQNVDEEVAFNFQVPGDTFEDVDGDMVLSATLDDDSPLPAWLNFDAETGTFTGTPDDPDVGTVTVKVTATDALGSVSDSFDLTVNPVNDDPIVSGPIVGGVADPYAASVVFHANFDDGTVNDLTGRHTVALETGSVTGGGPFSGQMLDGQGQVQTQSNDFAFDGDFTAELWMRPNQLTGDGFFLDTTLYDSNGAGGWWLYKRGAEIEILRNENGVNEPSDHILVGTMTAGEVGNWNHLAVTREGSTLRMFLNGEEIATSTYSDTLPAGNPLAIGGHNNGSYDFDGDIDDVRITKGVARYTSDFTVPDSPLPVASDNLFPFETSEDTAFTVTEAELLANASDVDGGTLSVDVATLAFAGGAIVQTSTDPDPRVWQVTPSADTNGVIQLTYDIIDGQGGRTETYAEVRVNPVDDPLAVDQGIANQNVDEEAVLSFQVPSDAFEDVDGDAVLSATLDDDSPLPAWLNFDSVTGTFTGTPDDPDVGTVTVKVTATDALGSVSDSFDLTVNPVNDDPIVSGPLVPSSDDPNFDDVVLLLRMDGNLEDSSAQDLTVTSVGGLTTSTSESKFGNGSLDMTATAGHTYLSVEDSALDMGTEDYTIEGWFYATALGGDNALFTLHTAEGGNKILVEQDDASGGARMYVGAGSPVQAMSNVFIANTWQHVALVRDASAGLFRLFVDGTQRGTMVDNVSDHDTFRLEIGTWSFNDDRDFTGYIDEFRVTKGLARYTSTFSPPDTPFPNLAYPFETSEQTSVVVSTAALLANASDAENDTLSVTLPVAANATVTDNGDGTFTVTPDAGFTGTLMLTYDVVDGNGGSASTYAEVLVSAAGAGADEVTGTEYGDTIFGGAGDDTLNGGEGDDLLIGGGDDDTLNGGADDDRLFGQDDDDVLTGGTGDDLLDGGDGADTLTGGDDNDHLIGGGGSDSLSGGDGDDILEGDICHADPAGGSKSASGMTVAAWQAAGVYLSARGLDGNPAALTFTNEGGYTKVGVDGGSQSAGQVNHEEAGGTEALIVDFAATVTSATVTFTNLFSNEDGGEQGLWRAYDAVGNLVGEDTFGPADVTTANNIGTLTITGIGSFDRLEFTAIPTVNEEAESDTEPGDSSDYFIAQVDYVAVSYTAGDDTLDGGAGDDMLCAGHGDDDLIGGLGQDVMEGGAGSDVFIYQSVADSGIGALLRDVIQDFDAGTSTTAVDTLDISAIVSGTFDFLGAESETFNGNGDTEARFNNATKILEIDADGDAEVDMEIELKDVDIANLDDSDFVVS